MSFFSRLFRPLSGNPSLSSSLTTTGTEAASSLSMPENAQKATVAAGCFWGVEHLFRKQFGDGKGLLNAKVGYCGGKTAKPSYQAVCTGTTEHAEALQMLYDPSKVSYRQLLEFFYRMHDPTTRDRQGPDVGTQYRSAIFTHGEEQEKVAKEVTEKAGKEWYKGKPITTIITPAGQWWDAEDYHQLYLNKNPSGYECPAHFVRNFSPLFE